MQNLNQKKVFCWKQRKTNLFCFRKEKCFLDGQSGSPLMFEVLYHSPKILGVSSLENQFARLWISAQKQFPPVPRSLFLLFQPKKSLLCFRKIIFLRVPFSKKILLIYMAAPLYMAAWGSPKFPLVRPACSDPPLMGSGDFFMAASPLNIPFPFLNACGYGKWCMRDLPRISSRMQPMLFGKWPNPGNYNISRWLEWPSWKLQGPYPVLPHNGASTL